jgi:polar amino acid transport system substrate-binding protein
MRRLRSSTIVVMSVLAVAACTAGGSPSPSASGSASASVEPSGAASPSESASACAADSLQTKTPGKLTIGSDNPAFPPYFEKSDPNPDPWELGDPTNGKGLEGATAYAIADALGFAKDDVVWVPVPFNNAIQPGEKDFDIYFAQVGATPERAQAVDLSDGYFDVVQAVVAKKDTPIANVKSLAELKNFHYGAQVGTTSLAYINDNIQPTTEPSVYDTNDAAIAALNAGQIDAIVADLPTTFYMRDNQITPEGSGVIVTQLPPVGDVEHFSVVLNKDSPLTDCVNQAIATIKADSTLPDIVQEWITSKGAPTLQ